MPEENIETKLPRRLFSKIIKRLNLEVQLKSTQLRLGIFGSMFVLFLVLSVVTLLGLKEVFTHSGFGNYLNLIFSDPRPILKFRESFTITILETIPGASMFIFLLVFCFLLLFIKFASFYLEKTLNLIKAIRNNTHAKNI